MFPFLKAAVDSNLSQVLYETYPAYLITTRVFASVVMYLEIEDKSKGSGRNGSSIVHMLWWSLLSFESSLVNTEKRCLKETLIWLVHCLMKHVKCIVLSLHFGGQY